MFEIGFAGAGGRGVGKSSTGGIANTEDMSVVRSRKRSFFSPKNGFLGLGGVLRRLGGEEIAGAEGRRGASL